MKEDGGRNGGREAGKWANYRNDDEKMRAKPPERRKIFKKRVRQGP